MEFLSEIFGMFSKIASNEALNRKSRIFSSEKEQVISGQTEARDRWAERETGQTADGCGQGECLQTGSRAQVEGSAGTSQDGEWKKGSLQLTE